MNQHTTSFEQSALPLDQQTRTNDRMNVADAERIVSVAVGASLLAFAATRRPAAAIAAATAGAGLIARGLTGRSVVYRAAHINTRDSETKRVLSGEGGIHVTESVLINRPVSEVYAFWRDLRNLPRFMSHLREVTPLNGNVSHWVANAPAGRTVEWDAEMINEVENKVIGWRSLEGADVVSAGSVNFRETPGRGTEVTVKLQYEPPAGRLGALVAKLFGEEPNQTIHEDLRRLKAQFEAGEVPTVEGQPHGAWKSDQPHAPNPGLHDRRTA